LVPLFFVAVSASQISDQIVNFFLMSTEDELRRAKQELDDEKRKHRETQDKLERAKRIIRHAKDASSWEAAKQELSRSLY
jgi:hypothetical protein